MSQRIGQKKPKVPRQKSEYAMTSPARQKEMRDEIYAERYPNAFSAASRGIKVGDRVRQAGWFAEYNRKNGKQNPEGTVTEIVPHNPNNPIEDHGGIEVMFDDGVERSFADYFKEDPLEKV